MVILQNAGMGTLEQNIELYPVEMGVTKFDLTIGFQESLEGLRGSIEYSTALYKAQTIARMGEHFVGLCRAIMAAASGQDPGTGVCGRRRKATGVSRVQRYRVDYPRDKCIHEFFVEQVDNAIRAKSSGVRRRSNDLSAALRKSRDLALYLQSLGVKPDSLVGLCMERSLDIKR